MKQITIGRAADNTIVVDAQYDTVSSNHATVTEQDGNVYLTDHSTNGTSINGQLITNDTLQIFPGDIIFLAQEIRLDTSVIMECLNQIEEVYYEPEQPTMPAAEEYYVQEQPQAGFQEPYYPQQPAANDFVQMQQPQQQEFQPAYPEQQYEPQAMELDNTSENTDAMPRRATRFSWGAFVFGWIWGIGNKVWWSFWTLVSLIPGLGTIASLIIAIILGVKGNRQAWAKYTGTPEQFDKKQKGWNIAGIVVFSVLMLILIVWIVLAFTVFSFFTSDFMKSLSF